MKKKNDIKVFEMMEVSVGMLKVNEGELKMDEKKKKKIMIENEGD